MKKRICILLLLIPLILTALVGVAYAEDTTGTVTDGDITFSYTYFPGETAEENQATVDGITVADTATGSVTVTVPDTVTVEGVDYPVTAVQLQLAGSVVVPEGAEIAQLILPQDVMIHGNLYVWQQNKTGETGLETGSYGENSFATRTNLPDTEAALAAIPSFITENYNYDSSGDGTNDTYYEGTNLVRVAPDYAGDLTVKNGTVCILAGSMEGCAGLGAVTLPDSVQHIGVRAFANSGVTAVNVPAELLTEGECRIPMQAFYGCDKLQTVTFPEGTDKLREVGYMAFFGCESLTGFDFSRTDKVNTLAFAKAFVETAEIDLAGAYYGPAVFSHSGIRKVTFGTGIADVNFEMFRNCPNLTEIVWNDSISRVMPWAFSDCEALTVDTLKDATSITELHHRCFANTGMTEITVPASVTNMHGGVFAGNEQLKTLNWMGSRGVSSGYSTTPAFAILNDCGKGQYQAMPYTMPAEADRPAEYTYPETLNLYGGLTDPFFNQLPWLKTVNFMDDRTAVGSNMFLFCPNLETVTFAHPEKLETINSLAFMGCLSLREFPFNELTGLRQIQSQSFMLKSGSTGIITSTEGLDMNLGLREIDLSGCGSLNEEKLEVQTNAFYNQYSATKIHLPQDALVNQAATFYGTVSVKELIAEGDLASEAIAEHFITAPMNSGLYNENLETITIKGQLGAYNGRVAFNKMGALKTVNLPNATALPQQCFLNCAALETVYAPMVTEVGTQAFAGTGLKEAVISAGVTYGDYAFQNCADLTKVVVEEGVTQLSDFMFEGCTALEQISLPSTLEKINWAAFKNARGSAVEIPASVLLIEDDAFSGSAFQLALRGTPVIELEHEGFTEEDLNTLLPIDGNSSIYYGGEAAKTVAEAYVAELAEEETKPSVAALPDAITLEITGAPETVYVDEPLDLSNFTVTYCGTALTQDQYILDYDTADKTPGERTVTVTVTDPELRRDSAEGVEFTAVDLAGETVTGKTYRLRSAEEDVTGTFQLNVIDPAAPANKQQWTGTADSETVYSDTEGEFVKAFDNNTNTIWHTNWRPTEENPIGVLTGENTFTGEINFGAAYDINQFSFLPRQDDTMWENGSGVLLQASLYVKAAEDAEWVCVADQVVFEHNQLKKTFYFEEQSVQFVKLVCERSSQMGMTDSNGPQGYVAVAEFYIDDAAAADLNITAAKIGEGTVTGVPEAAVAIGTSVTLTAEAAEGYTFDGWYNSLDTKVSADAEYTFPAATNIALTAKFALNSYTVTFDHGYEGTDDVTRTVDHGQTVSNLPAPTREGYTFDGWFCEDGNEFTAETVVTGDITVTAKWTAIPTYTVTLDFGYDGKIDTVTVEEGKTVEALPTPEREGYNFEGWFDAEDNVFTTETVVTGDITVIAKWTENIPEETKPEETKPEETKPEETKPEETVPEETKPEDKPVVPECPKDETCVLSQFADIIVNDWYHDGIHFCVEEGIMNGMGEGVFAPNEPTTRAQLVTMLYRLEGEPTIEGKTEPFADVAETDWFYAPIVWAYNNKVVNGISDTEFAPNANVTREQVATILYRFLESPEGTGKLDEFPDVAKVSGYAVDALTWAVGAKLITGVAQPDGTTLLDPAGNATRAQIATILMRHLTA